MINHTCLLIKPNLTDPALLVQQQGDIQSIIKQAIRQAGLTLLGRHDGIVVQDIPSHLVNPLMEQLHQTDIVLVDANPYNVAGATALSPYLYYFIALRHAMGNRTILVTRSAHGLPPSLIKHHTLIYGVDPAGIADFYERFCDVVKAILEGKDDEPDNPFQEYLQAKASEAAKAQAADKEAQLEALKRQLDEKRKPSPTITFRPLN